MTTRTLLLSLHIAAVAAWLGANFVQIVITPRFAREGPGLAAAWNRQQMWLGERYYSVAGAVIAISGVFLVLDGDWSWSGKFIWVGIGVIIIGGVMGVALFTPLAKQSQAALDAGDMPTANAVRVRVTLLGLLDTALVLTAILAMVHKWQA